MMTTRNSLDTSVDALYAYVCMGSNMGDRAGNLLLGVRGMLDAGLKVRRLSSVYETEPVDVKEQPVFLNMVAELAIALLRPSPEQLLARLLRVEYALGRRRRSSRATARGPRTIDLDLLLYGEEQRATPFLTLPHPRMAERRFVLVPLAELRPDLQHPLLRRTIRQLLAETHDHAKVTRWKASVKGDDQ